MFDDFLIDNLFLPFFKIAETFVVAAQNAAVEPEGCPGGVAQKHPVMADENDRAAKIGDDFFKFFNRGHIQMVGRFVQEQNVRFVNQRFGQSGFFPFAAGRLLGALRGADVKLLNQDVCAVFLTALMFGQAGKHNLAQRGVTGKVRILRHIGNLDAGLNKDFAGIGFNVAGNYFQQRRLAAAVAADQRDFVAAVDIKFNIGKQLVGAERQTGAFDSQNRRFKHGLQIVLDQLRAFNLPLDSLGGPQEKVADFFLP